MIRQELGLVRERKVSTHERSWMIVYPIFFKTMNNVASTKSTYSLESGLDVMSEWFMRQGQSVILSESSSWCAFGPRVFQAIPFFRTIEPEESELRHILVRSSAVALRFSAPRNSGIGAVSYHVVCDSRDYDFCHLSRQSRQNVARGLASCSVEPVPFSLLAEHGWGLHIDTLARQSRRDRRTRADWKRRCRIAAELPGFEAWAALVNGKLAAVMQLVRIQEWIILLEQDSLSEYLPFKPNHALVYCLTKELMKREGIKSIFYTMQSLDAPSHIDQFKVRMGYRAIPVKQRVVFHPALGSLVGLNTHAMLKKLQFRYPSNPWLAKAEGLVRVAVIGAMPELDQNIPSILKDDRRLAYLVVLMQSLSRLRSTFQKCLVLVFRHNLSDAHLISDHKPIPLSACASQPARDCTENGIKPLDRWPWNIQLKI